MISDGRDRRRPITNHLPFEPDLLREHYLHSFVSNRMIERVRYVSAYQFRKILASEPEAVEPG